MQRAEGYPTQPDGACDTYATDQEFEEAYQLEKPRWTALADRLE